jgi:hypothetical protein
VLGSSHYTVLELHRFLQDLADNASASGDDLLDITSSTPSERSTVNIITLLGPTISTIPQHNTSTAVRLSKAQVEPKQFTRAFQELLKKVRILYLKSMRR